MKNKFIKNWFRKIIQVLKNAVWKFNIISEAIDNYQKIKKSFEWIILMKNLKNYEN